MRLWRRHPLLRRQFVVFALIALSVVLFLVQSLASPELIFHWGAVPVRLLQAWHELLDGRVGGATWAAAGSLLTSIFLHANAEHLVGNMLYLWVLGCVVRDVTSRAWVFGLYMFCGAAGQIVHAALNPLSAVPTIGASGAISGLAGMYFGLCLSWRLPDAGVWPLSGPVSPLRLAIFCVAGFAVDVWSLGGPATETAYGAHVGGFMTGLLIAACLTATFRTHERFQSSGLAD